MIKVFVSLEDICKFNGIKPFRRNYNMKEVL